VVSNLIINGDIINPPTSVTCFRELTLIAKKAAHLEVIIECLEKDFCWRYLKNLGAMDYVDDILNIGEEEGFRIDTEYHFSPTVFIADRIDHYNFNQVLNAIGFNQRLY
jgi:hypothetical protein